MTGLIKRSQTRHVADKTRHMRDLRALGVEIKDPTAAQNFARQCLWGKDIQALETIDASDVGLLALALSGWVIKHAKAMHAANLAQAKSEDQKVAAQMAHPIVDIFKDSLPLDFYRLQGTLKDLIDFAPMYARFAAKSDTTNLGVKALQQNKSALLSHSTYMTDWGCDGHPWSREVTARLRLTRFFEKTTGEFAKFLAQAFTALVKNGPAYIAWSSNFPVLIADMNETNHRRLANLLCEQCHGECVVVGPSVANDARGQLDHRLLTVADTAGIFQTMAGAFAPAMLLERRLGGWTVTFPCGEIDARDLTNPKLPALARALAQCAENPVHAPVKKENNKRREILKNAGLLRADKSKRAAKRKLKVENP